MNLQAVRSRSRTAETVFFLIDILLEWWLLVCAMLVAVQIRLRVPLGQVLMPGYQPAPALMFVVFALAVLLAVGVARSPLATSSPVAAIFADEHPFRRFLAVVLITAVANILLLPDLSQLQIGYFVGIAFLLGVFCIALPRRLYPELSSHSVFEELLAVWERRSLLFLWLNFNIQTRYSQRILGLLWIILLPVVTSVVLAFAFTQFMHVQVDAPFIVFYMSALVPYNFFANNLYGSTDIILKRIMIITQVYFPREILALLLVGETLFDFIFAFIAMLVVNLLSGVTPNIQFVFLPFLYLILTLIILGLVLISSALTVIVRDIPQLLSVALQLLFFLTPVIYPIEQFPERFQFLFVLNPIAPLIQGSRDIIAFGRPPDLLSLAFPIAFATVVLTVGYATFKAFEMDMTDLL